jgi:hypothetical protein
MALLKLLLFSHVLFKVIFIISEREYQPEDACTLGGFNFIFWGISLGIKWRMIEIGKNYFLLFEKYLKR